MDEYPFDLDRVGGAAALRALVEEVLAAGEAALHLYRSGAAQRAETKPDRSPVTEADREVEARLRTFCDRRFPNVAFVGEETGSHGGRGPDAMRFVVDPIDGTRAFLRGIPTWSILIGLEVQRRPVLGIAYMPAMNELFVAVDGQGAEGNGRPLRVSGVDRLDAAVISHGSLNQFTDAGLSAVLPVLGEHTYTQRGFADFDGYRNLLLGRVDAMIDPGVKIWDVCAPAVLVREAGGRLTDLAGDTTLHDGTVIATNGWLHDPLLELLGTAGAADDG